MEIKHLTIPIDKKAMESLKAGEGVLISGVIYAMRDAAHRRVIEALEKGQEPPFKLKDQVIYYMGPSPTRPGNIIGAAGPTTATRMDIYTLELLRRGVRIIIGKGNRSGEVKQAIINNKALYLAAIGGAGALLAQKIKKAEVVAYEDLGAEAILRLEVNEFPAVIALDSSGGDIFAMGKKLYGEE
jgi:fumarate hydratase subunit beta